MDTRSDNLTKVPVATKSRKPVNKDIGLRRKVSSAVSERQSIAVLKKREIPPLTPLHRLQRFKAIRDKNLKNKGFKTSLEVKKMEEVATTSTSKVDINEKVIIKEIVGKMEVSNSNVIEKLEENVKELTNGSSKEIGRDEANSSPKEEQRRSARLSEIKNVETVEIVVVEKKEKEDPKDGVSITVNLEQIKDSNIESQTETDDKRDEIKTYSGSVRKTLAPSGEEEDVEIIKSKTENESNSKQNESDSVKQKEDVACNKTSCSNKNISINKNIKKGDLYNALSRKKAIRDKNLKNKGFKTSLEGELKTMEEVTTASSITKVEEIKEKVIIKETVEKNEVSNTNGIEKLEGNVKGFENGSSEENGHNEAKSSPKEDQRRSTRLSEIKNEDKTVEIVEAEEKEKEYPKDEVSNEVNLERIQDSNIESQTENEEENENKAYSESLGESDAVSISSLQAVASSSLAPTDDEEEDVEIIESKSEYESNSKQNRSDSVKLADQAAGTSYSNKATARTSGKYFSSSSVASSYRSSYGSSNIGQRIYGRRPVRYHAASRKRKMEEELIKNNDHKRTSSPSVPSPRWRFIPSTVNFWTPRTTPFAFPASTPVPNLSDSMTVNIDEDTIHSNMDDSDLFSDANEFAPQPPKKGRWGCAIM